MKPDVRDRLVLPLLIPVVLVVIIASVATLFGMIMFFNPMVVSTTLALVVAAGLVVAFALASSKPQLPRAKAAVIAGACIVPLGIGALVALGVVEPIDDRVAERECEYCVPADAVPITAANLAFDTDTLELPATGDVHILFVNNEQAVPHNLAIYPQDESGAPVLDAPLFQGDIFSGEGQRVYTFEAPGQAGVFRFQCDVHPAMSGDAIFGLTAP